jgi:isoleucyl-tRNA synthetase
MADKGYLYKGLKAVQWCPNCETALAEAEVEYADHVSDSIYVKFPVDEESRAKMPAAVRGEKDLSFVIWTTTPWTLPANLGMSVHPKFDYVFLRTPNDGVVIIADELKKQVAEAVGWNEAELQELARVKGSELEHTNGLHPFANRKSLVMVGEHVTAEAGTGVVHTAPGHGPEDFVIGQKYGIGVLNPVDPRGIYTKDGGQWEGQRFDKANPLIVEHLKEIGALLKHSTYSHSYPHCWRCKKPLIFRATEQWFASVDGFRDAALKAIDQVQWLPASGRNRIFTMVENRSDWCISRQRAWGVPIPLFYCNACEKPVVTKETTEEVATIFGEQGSDAWWEHEAEYFVGKDFKCSHCGEAKGFTKETDIMDVWFDSGVTHAAVIDARADELGGTPCEMYLEGSDQHRGWFQSSLLTSVAIHGRAPYKTVLTHGFVVDENGRKMSKSVGNVVEPDAVIKQYGADVLRLWVASVNYTDDVPIGKNMLTQLADVYFRLRNTSRFLLGNLFDFDPKADAVPYEKLQGLEKYVLHRLQELVSEVIADFDNYEFFKYYQLLQNFCAVDLSSFYFDIVKDPLYAAGKKSEQRRAVQTVLNEVLQVLVRLLVPVTPHLAEDIWKHMPDALRGTEESVLLTSFPQVNTQYLSEALSKDWNQLIEVRNVVNKALEQARGAGKIGKPMEAQALVHADKPEVAKLLSSLGNQLAPFFITSQASVVDAPPANPNALSSANANGVSVQVLQASGTKCPRCRKFTEDVGSDKRFDELCGDCAKALTE